MDLERLGNTEAAARFVSDYEERVGALLPPSLLHTYIALRAYVRIKVACTRHEQGKPEAAEEAVGLLELAQTHLERGRVRLVLVGGLPGSGKSTLANALGDALGAIVLRSDELRGGRSSAVADRCVATTFRRGRYAPRRTQDVYNQLISAARQHLGLGQSVVLDASWIDASKRVLAQALATESSADLTELHCTAPPEVTEGRIATRLQHGKGPSEATVEIGRAMALVEAPWPSATGIDTTRPPGVVLAEALRIMGVAVVEVPSTG
jgi:hypothetical protein